MNNIKSWEAGYTAGVESIMTYLQEMLPIDIEALTQDWGAWECLDEYTKFNGEKVRRYD